MKTTTSSTYPINLWIARAYSRLGILYAANGQIGVDDINASISEMEAVISQPQAFGITPASSIWSSCKAARDALENGLRTLGR